MSDGGPYGWYGKMPSLGDFARCALSPAFIQTWDAWLQDMLIAGRNALGPRWQECYMTAPIWRFALGPALCGAHPVAGVVMPSVDRVGRQFPLCIAAEATSQDWPGCLPAYCALEPAFSDLENAALAMLEDGATQQVLAERLAELPHPDPKPVSPTKSFGNFTTQTTRRSVAEALASRAVDGKSAIWVALVAGQHRIMTTDDLPNGPEATTAFFDIDAECWMQTDANHPEPA